MINNFLQSTANDSTSIINAAPITGELCSRWVQYLDAKPKTIQTYTRNIKPFMEYLHLNGITHPTRDDIIAYREQVKATHKPTTTQAYIQAIKLFFQWLEQEGLYTDIAKHIKGAKLDTDHKKDPLTAKQAAQLLSSINTDSLTGKRDYAIISLMITSGLRTIEIIRANIEEIRNIGDFTALFIQGKGHDEKNTYIKLAEPVEKAIRSYLKARGKAPAAAPLFVSHAHRNDGERLTTRSISRLAKENLKAAGYDSERLTAHSFRHTAATLNLLNGATIEETQQLLRHTNINTTMIYAHALERANNNSETRIANAIFG